MNACTASAILALALLPLGTPAQSPAVVVGRDGWLFWGAELRHLAAGPFWGGHAAKASQAEEPQCRDPEAALAGFADALKEHGVTLLFVPVPPKAVVMADKLPAPGKPGDGAEHQAAFYARLREQGVQVLDLTGALVRARTNETASIYCRTDGHWGPDGIAIAAAEIAAAVRRAAPEALPASPADYSVERAELVISGDLWKLRAAPDAPKETLAIEAVKTGGQTPRSEETAKVLLLGDSHTMFLSTGGEMHAAGAGLPEHLARRLGGPIEVNSTPGSGAGPARMNLVRKAWARPGWLAGKKVVVYCIASRELTEATGLAWKVLPLKVK